MLGSSKMSVGGLGIDAKVEERFKIIFLSFLEEGGRNSSWRAHLLGWGDEMEGEV